MSIFDILSKRKAPENGLDVKSSLLIEKKNLEDKIRDLEQRVVSHDAIGNRNFSSIVRGNIDALGDQLEGVNLKLRLIEEKERLQEAA
ncbi:MAG TPA: hypothetical protein VJH71_01950 [Candidatus Paceibacterota bacterium]